MPKAKELQSAKKDDATEKNEWEEKNRIASEGYEAFKAGIKNTENPYRLKTPVDAYSVNYWDRGLALAERKRNRDESL